MNARINRHGLQIARPLHDLVVEQILPGEVSASASIVVDNTPPRIIVSNSPAILVPIDGAPVIKPVPGDSRFNRVINTRALILKAPSEPQFFLRVYDGWLMANALDGPWTQPFIAPAGIDAVARKVAGQFPKPPKVRSVRFVTTQRARWGSYSPSTGLVRLHASLRQLPAWVLEAVVAHELAHAFHADHSPAFWNLVREVCPATDRASSFLEGVSWIAERWERFPPVERSLLTGC